MRIDQAYTDNRDGLVLAVSMELAAAKWKVALHDGRREKPAVHTAAHTMLTPRAAIAQILMLDLVFSIDSIVTAVGMTSHVAIMYIAVIVAVAAMLVAAAPLSRFIEHNPTIVMLALSFLLVIGMTLIAEGFGSHVPKGYIYAAMAFSAFVEGMNMLARRARLHRRQRRAG